MDAKEKQLSLENGLFHEEREELRLLDCMAKTFNVICHLKSRIEASSGNYPTKSKKSRMLDQAATSLAYQLYWMGLIQSLTTNELAKSSNYQPKSIEHYMMLIPNKGYQVDLVATPHGLYESYLRAYRELETCLKVNQKTIDRIPKGNDLVIYILDSMQSAGEFLEEIL